MSDAPIAPPAADTSRPRRSSSGNRNYYFLCASLVDLQWGQEPPSGTTEELLQFVRGELNGGDLQATRELFLFNDIRNAVTYHEPADAYRSPSCYRRAELLGAADGSYPVLPFLAEYFEGARSGVRRFPDIPEIDEATILFFEHIDDIGHPFIRDFYRRELDMRNLSIAVSHEQQELPYRERLIPIGPVYEAIVTGSPPDFGVGRDFPFLARLAEVYREPDLTEQERVMQEIRWNWIDDRVGPAFFSLEYVLGYLLKYQSIERWSSLSEDKGDEVFTELVTTARRSVRFALEFAVGEKKDDDRQSKGN